MIFSGPLTAANGVVLEGGLSNAIFGKVEGGSNVTGLKWSLSRQRSERQRECAGNDPRQDVQHLYS
jgi:hypothetical protein